MSICAINFLPKDEYSNPSIVAAFPNKSFSGKISFPANNSYLTTFPDDEAEISVNVLC